ncbi:MAG: hypothetical protein AAF488_13685 [Planctomycetota bacterium]
MRMIVSLCAALLVCGLVSCSESENPRVAEALTRLEATEIAYYHDWAAALEEARAEGKPVMINFGGDW